MQPYIPLPPLPETVREFFKKGLAKPLTMNKFGGITIPNTSPFFERAVQSALGTWAEQSAVGINVQRNQFNRWTATIGRPIINLNGEIIGAKPLCSYTHEREGEALFRAVMLYEEKKANGDFDNLANDNQSKGLIDEFGARLENSHAERSLEPEVQGGLAIPPAESQDHQLPLETRGGRGEADPDAPTRMEGDS
jgi:hypothetical protein